MAARVLPRLGTGGPVVTPARKRLPNRRPSHTETLEIAGQIFTGTVGFDPEDGRPRELFLNAGKEGSLINAMLADAAVAISVALQHGVSAQALAKSIGRLPDASITPAVIDQSPAAVVPASPIGAALDLVSSFENEPAGPHDNCTYQANRIR